MSDKQIIEAMNLQDEKDSIRADMLKDEYEERKLRTDIDYFLERNGFSELEEMYQKLSKKAWEYGWVDVKVKDYL